jgi:hypothetical protein
VRGQQGDGAVGVDDGGRGRSAMVKPMREG